MAERISLIVSFTLPDAVNRTEAAAYVRDAVRVWNGQYRPPGGYEPEDPGDPRFGMGRDATVKPLAGTRVGPLSFILDAT